jgi:hypothetical protein
MFYLQNHSRAAGPKLQLSDLLSKICFLGLFSDRYLCFSIKEVNKFYESIIVIFNFLKIAGIRVYTHSYIPIFTIHSMY